MSEDSDEAGKRAKEGLEAHGLLSSPFLPGGHDPGTHNGGDTTRSPAGE